MQAVVLQSRGWDGIGQCHFAPSSFPRSPPPLPEVLTQNIAGAGASAAAGSCTCRAYVSIVRQQLLHEPRRHAQRHPCTHLFRFRVVAVADCFCGLSRRRSTVTARRAHHLGAGCGCCRGSFLWPHVAGLSKTQKGGSAPRVRTPCNASVSSLMMANASSSCLSFSCTFCFRPSYVGRPLSPIWGAHA